MKKQGGEWPVTLEQQAVAQDLHRRRLAAGQGVAPDYRTALAEVVFLAQYSHVPNMSDLKVAKRSLQFIITDDDGRTLRVIQQTKWPMRVWSSKTDVDSYVFTTVGSRQMVQIIGWLPAEQVEEAPIWWQIENGIRIDYAFEVARDFLYPMPTEFKFTDSCSHSDYGALWNYTYNAWECCGCGYNLYSREDANVISKQDERIRRRRSEDTANETRDER